MSETAHGTDDPDLPADPVLTTNGPQAPDLSDGCGLNVGQRWRDLNVEAAIDDHGGGSSFLAQHVGLMQHVVVRATRITAATDWRRRAWEQLRALPEAQFVGGVECHEEGEWRYEMTTVPPPTSLRDWIACHRPNFGDIERFVRQMAESLGAMHQRGLVHLGLRPESIFVDETGSEPIFLVGGLNAATLYSQPELIAAEVDPYYAPPEAAGLVRHAPGPKLCAWDWWSLGRVVQEFLLGRHVLSLVLDRDVSRVNPELAARAEMLLLEREPPDVRAGALEYMPGDSGTMPLLRGLLTSSTEARWGLNAVGRWLRREAVRDHYDLPRNARLWSWQGRGFTVAEAAEFFTQAENWDVGEDQLFQPKDPATLAYFLNEVPAHRADWERLQTVCELAESVAWKEVPVIVRRTVTAAASWLSLGAGAGGRPSFRIRGQAVDLTGLAALLELSGAEKGPALFRALLSPAVILFVDSLDGPAARVLRTMAANAGRAVDLALEHGWLDRDDSAEQARMLGLAFLNGTVLRERLDLLRATYATNANSLLAQMLANKTPEVADLIVLAHLGQAPDKNGFITHERWRRERSAALKSEGEQIVTRLLWCTLQRLLATHRLWGASSTVFAGGVLVLTGFVGSMSRHVGPTALVPAILLLSRIGLWWRIRGMVRRFDASAGVWRWGDGRARSAAEVERVFAGRSEAPVALRKRLRRVRESIAEIITNRSKRPVVAEPHWWDLWLGLSVVSLVVVAVVVKPLITRHITPESTAALSTATQTAAAVPVAAAIPKSLAALNGEVVTDPDALLATGRYEVLDDGFGRRLRGPLEKWDRVPPATVAEAEIEMSAPASADQSAYAMVSGALLLRPYGRKAVRVLLAVRVPTTRGFGVVIYNARDHELFNRQVMLLRNELHDNTWYQLGRYRVLYLESPLPAAATISLAPP